MRRSHTVGGVHQTPSPIHSDTLRCNAYLPSSTPAYPSTCPVPAPSVQHSMEGDGQLLAKRALSDNQPGELAVLANDKNRRLGVWLDL